MKLKAAQSEHIVAAGEIDGDMLRFETAVMSVSKARWGRVVGGVYVD